MKTIKEPVKNIVLLWRQPKPEKAVYRPMKYLLKTQVEDGTLLYNIVTSEMILLDDTEARLFESLPALYSAWMNGLIARHFIVKEDFEEKKSVPELRALVKKLEPSKRVTGFTILPTTECNARCYYCFESDHKKCTMTDTIAADAVEYIAEKCKAAPIEISWFGGEPLVGRKYISQICDGLKKKGIKFSSSMVTNAYLFDEGLIREAKDEWHLRRIQITLDGTEEVYNAAKAYVSPRENPYKRVIRNIGLLLDQDILVNIRLNVTDQNITDLNVLIDELVERFGGRQGFSCYSHAVYEGVGFDPLDYDDSIRKRIDTETVLLDAKLRENRLLGNLAKLPSLRFVRCMTDNDSCRVIYPDGTIGRCEDKSSALNVGDIYNDITDAEMNGRYKETAQIPECEDCCLYPDCINLAMCPETGQCTKTKVEWKLDRYSVLMADYYRKYLENDSKEDQEKSNLLDCEV